MRESFVDPVTKKTLERTPEGAYCCTRDGQAVIYSGYDGCYDFVGDGQAVHVKRQVYDDVYSNSLDVPLTTQAIAEAWQDPTVPWRKTMLGSLGDLSGKTVLLLGNGSSYKEFYFLFLGARLTFTDLSLEAVRRARDRFRRSDFFSRYEGLADFHAVDAMRLPFPDESFDVIYGTKCVGFFDDRSLFFSEAERCLKPTGICRFSDDAVSPIFEAVKRTLLRPMQLVLYPFPAAHARVRGAACAGFDESEMNALLDQFSFRNRVWIRQNFFLRITQLVHGKFVKWAPERISRAKRLLLFMKWVDQRFETSRWYQRNALALTWGFDK